MAANAVFDVGMPGEKLLRAGLPNLPLRLRRGVFRRRANKHTEFTEAALLALPDAFQNPMAVFVSPGDRKAHGIVTMLPTPAGPVAAYFTVRTEDGAQVLHAKTVFGKEVGLLLPELREAQRQNLLTFVDKRAFDNWLAQGDGISKGDASAQHGHAIEGLTDFFAQFDTESKPPVQFSRNGRPLRTTQQAVLDALRLLKDRLPGLQNGRVLAFAKAAEFLASGYARADTFTAEEIDGMQDAEGFYDNRTGHTIVFTDQITPHEGETPIRAVARVLLHERVGHDGLNTLIAQDASHAARWQKIASRIPAAELDAIAAEAGYTHLAGDRAQLALEWLARQVESVEGARNAIDIERSLSGVAKQLWQVLKELLAKMFDGFSRQAAFAHEVHEIITLAREAALNGTADPTTAAGLVARVQFSHLSDADRDFLERFTLKPLPPPAIVADAGQPRTYATTPADAVRRLAASLAADGHVFPGLRPAAAARKPALRASSQGELELAEQLAALFGRRVVVVDTDTSLPPFNGVTNRQLRDTSTPSTTTCRR